MNWFLIGFGIAVVISPLMWLRQSPQAKRMTELRGMATQLSIQVSLHRRPDAREDEVSLDSVCYRLPWLDWNASESWVLQRFSPRGWDSHCEGWRWTQHQAHPDWDDLLAQLIPALPTGVSALIASKAGIGMIWDERGDALDLEKIAATLQLLREKKAEICH